MDLKFLRIQDFVEAIKVFEPKAVIQTRRSFLTGFEFHFRVWDGRKLTFKTGHNHDQAEQVIKEIKKTKVPVLYATWE